MPNHKLYRPSNGVCKNLQRIRAPRSRLYLNNWLSSLGIHGAPPIPARGVREFASVSQWQPVVFLGNCTLFLMSFESPAALEPFPATEWTLVARAGEGGRPRGAALAELVRRYHEPLRSHLIWIRRINPDHAADLLQGFLTSQVVERGLVRRAERSKGRFRTFILLALDRYVKNRFREARAAKRAPDRAAALDERADFAHCGPAPVDPFDAAWARQVLNEAIQCMQRECSLSERPDVWGVFEARIMRPAFERAKPLSYNELVRQFNLSSPSQASNVLITAKRMFQRCLSAVIAEYEPDAAAIEREVLELREILSRPAPDA